MVKISFDVPKAMREIAKSPDIQEHPYDLCFECPFYTVSCDGPNERAMTMQRQVEWYKRLGKKRGITQEKAAEISGIPFNTLRSVMSGKTEDPRHSTMQAISKAYSGGCWGKYPCHFAALLINDELDENNDTTDYQARYEGAQREVMRLEQRLEIIMKESDKKVDYLKGEVAELKKGRKQCLLIILALFIFIVFVLIMDITHPGLGWLRW